MTGKKADRQGRADRTDKTTDDDMISPDPQTAPSGRRLRSIFTTIETPRLAIYREKMNARPTRFILLFAAVSFAFTFALSLGGLEAAIRDMPAVQVMHVSVIPLIFGVCLFPIERLTVPVGVFLVCYFTGLFLEATLVDGQTTGPQLALIGLATNLVAGLASGLIGRIIFARISRSAMSSGFDAIAGLTLTVSYAVVGPLVSIAALLVLMPETFGTYGFYGPEELFFRAMRLGMVAAASLMVFLDFPDGRHLRETLTFAPAFAVLGYLSQAGLTMHPTLDAMMLGLALLLLRPIYPAISAVLTGFMIFTAITGNFVVQVFLDTAAAMRFELLSTAMFVMVFMVGVARIVAHASQARQAETLGRLARAQDLSHFGYFVVHIGPNLLLLDSAGQRILGAPSEVSFDQILDRIHPEDRIHVDSVEAAARAGARLSLRYALADLWTPEAEQRIISIYMGNETLWDGRQVFYGIVADVTAEHSQERQLRDVLAELSDRQSRQTQLFSIISHELRTPAAMLSMIIDEMDEGAKWGDMGPQMRAVMDHMLSILGDMRQTVRPEQNLPITMQTFRPQDLAESIRNSVQMLARGKGISVELRMAPEAMENRVTDKVRLSQALQNLLKNAIVHSRATIVTIAYREEATPDGGLNGFWRVWDNGRNIPEDFRNHLFEPFRREGNGTARPDGSGLGLFIAQSAMRLLGGDLVYVHRSNSGAEFQVTVPLARVNPATAADADALPAVAAGEAAGVDISGLHVLLVEDSHMMGSLMAARLERLFDRVTWVPGGMQAIASVSKSAPDVILTDLFMPGMGGDELVRTLRSQGFRQPIVGMTAAEVGDEIERFCEAGADRVMTKPVRMDDLITTLNRLLPRKERARGTAGVRPD